MKRKQLLLLLALLMTAATGAWAQEPATTYSVKMKDGTEDAKNWTITSGEKSATGDAADGLTGLSEKDAVTLQYNGRLKVKSVTATSVAAPAEATPAPEGAINGKFSVSATKQVYFSKGNLRYVSGAWSFFDNQYDYYNSYSADAWNHFGWSTFVTNYGMKTSTTNGDYYGDFMDWGSNSDLQTALGTGWFTLSSDEWEYLFNTRSASTVGDTENARYTQATINTDGTGVNGVILFPDGATFAASEATPWGTINGASDWTTKCTTAQWTALESKGCVFLPAAVWRYRNQMVYAISCGRYWSGTAIDGSYAYCVIFSSGSLNPAASGNDGGRCRGYSVRLVREVATTDPAAAKPAATVTTVPTGAAIVGVGKTTELVSGGVADGGTLMYAVTTTNTKPTSTAGFSDAVPTAQSITASGKVYVWYYVKADDTHSDSEIAATAIEVPVADIVWDVTNVSDLDVYDGGPYEMEGVTMSSNSGNIFAQWADYGDPTMDGIDFQVYESGGLTFTAPSGKKFTKIEMKALASSGWETSNLGTGWAYNALTVTWKGTAAASTVDLLKDADEFYGTPVNRIVFYLSE